jgi:hypothetical protein
MPKAISLYRWLAPLLLSVSAWPQTPLGELFATDPGSPSVAQPAGSGMTVVAGSQLSAGVAPAILKLYHGGQVRMCPKTKLSINSDARGLMLGMDAGAVEVDFQLEQNSTDIVFTPDLSIRLAGAGVYHFAFGVNGRGDTCFKPLPGNAAGIVLSELMGSDEYGIAADQTAFFPGGKLSARTALTTECGCPPPPPSVRAEASPGTSPTPSETSATKPAPGLHSSEAAPTSPAEGNQKGQGPVEAPFVFSANAPPAPASVQFSTLPNIFLAQNEVDPAVLPQKEALPTVQEPKPTPAASAADNSGKKEKKGFMARLKGFFTGLFHR